eukprot:8519314-Alexandrium_andersonii.AAC.1
MSQRTQSTSQAASSPASSRTPRMLQYVWQSTRMEQTAARSSGAREALHEWILRPPSAAAARVASERHPASTSVPRTRPKTQRAAPE